MQLHIPRAPSHDNLHNRRAIATRGLYMCNLLTRLPPFLSLRIDLNTLSDFLVARFESVQRQEPRSGECLHRSWDRFSLAYVTFANVSRPRRLAFISGRDSCEINAPLW